MRTEKEIRQYRDAVKHALAQPCNCAVKGGPDHYRCVMGGKFMETVIRNLDWVLGDSDEQNHLVEQLIADHMRAGG